MIRLCRVDHRLLHGQVAYAWMQSLSVNCILISSDTVVADELRMAVLKMAKPAGVKLVMKSVAESAKRSTTRTVSLEQPRRSPRSMWEA